MGAPRSALQHARRGRLCRARAVEIRRVLELGHAVEGDRPGEHRRLGQLLLVEERDHLGLERCGCPRGPRPRPTRRRVPSTRAQAEARVQRRERQREGERRPRRHRDERMPRAPRVAGCRSAAEHRHVRRAPRASPRGRCTAPAPRAPADPGRGGLRRQAQEGEVDAAQRHVAGQHRAALAVELDRPRRASASVAIGTARRPGSRARASTSSSVASRACPSRRSPPTRWPRCAMAASRRAEGGAHALAHRAAAERRRAARRGAAGRAVRAPASSTARHRRRAPRGRGRGASRECSSSIATERIAASGFATSCPAMSGAEPCTGS